MALITSLIKNQIITYYLLKLTSHDILHYLWSADLSKKIYQLTVSIFIFLSIFFSIDFAWWKRVGLPHIAYTVIH